MNCCRREAGCSVALLLCCVWPAMRCCCLPARPTTVTAAYGVQRSAALTASGGTVLTPSGPMAIVSNTQQHHRRTQAAAYEKVRRRRAKQRAASRIYKREAIVDSAGCAHHKHITSILARALGREWLRGASHSSSDGTVWLRLRWPAYDIRKGSRADMHSADRPCARPDSRALRLDRIS